jgi:hypothetical protein
MRWPGIEPGSTAWKATMLTSIPPSLVLSLSKCKTRKSLSSFLFVDITNFHENIFELFILYNFTKQNNQGPK